MIGSSTRRDVRDFGLTGRRMQSVIGDLTTLARYGQPLDDGKVVALEGAVAAGQAMAETNGIVGLQSRFWIEDPDRGDFVRVRSEYVQAVKERFDDAGIDMPYVHRQLTGSVEVLEQAVDQ